MKARVLALASAAAALTALAAVPARAALDQGATAPEFTTKAFLAGKAFDFNLDEALKKGPVVLYFFPAAYTPGCQIEAHLFAEAADQFKAQHATVIGVTAGKTDQLEKFSTDTQYCSGKFAMAADTDLKIATSYKSLMAERPLSDRTSYVIGKDHKIALVYSNLNPNDHVTQTMAAVKKLNGKS
ncbi:MAG TPA: peroxiredoxin [Caulobacteraceae bacterium]|jgi:peroxiredoxin